MNIYLVEYEHPTGWDEYGGFVVINETPEQTFEQIKSILKYDFYPDEEVKYCQKAELGDWKITKIGEAVPDYNTPQVILEDFRAG